MNCWWLSWERRADEIGTGSGRVLLCAKGLEWIGHENVKLIKRKKGLDRERRKI